MQVSAPILAVADAFVSVPAGTVLVRRDAEAVAVSGPGWRANRRESARE